MDPKRSRGCSDASWLAQNHAKIVELVMWTGKVSKMREEDALHAITSAKKARALATSTRELASSLGINPTPEEEEAAFQNANDSGRTAEPTELSAEEMTNKLLKMVNEANSAMESLKKSVKKNIYE